MDKSGLEVPAPIVMDDPELNLKVFVAATTHCAFEPATENAIAEPAVFV